MPNNITNDQQLVGEIQQHESGNADMGGMLVAPDPGMVIWTWLIFFVFLFVLRKFAWKPILNSLEEREEYIKKSINDAAAAKQAIEEASQEQQKLIDKGRQQASEAINNARSSATAGAEDIIHKAREESEKLITEARDEIIKQQEDAMTELRSDVANLSVLVASKLLDADLNTDRNRGLATEYLAGFTS